MLPTSDCHALLVELGAPARLRTHATLVLEAAEELLGAKMEQGLAIEGALVRAGALLHDIGKTLHPNELHARGSLHEAAGEKLLLGRGVDPRVARMCVTHADWRGDRSLEELLVALADKLWKGVRVADLEARVVDAVAAARNVPRWEVFVSLDERFEAIAALGDARLARSA